MTNRNTILLSGAMLLTLTSCSNLFEAGGQKVALMTDIQFRSDTGVASANETVYVVETIGTMHPVTEVLKTDAEGHVVLRGNYCLPTIVAIKGGGVTLQTPTLKPSYSVIVKEGDVPSLEQLYGNRNSEFRDRKDCG